MLADDSSKFDKYRVLIARQEQVLASDIAAVIYQEKATLKRVKKYKHDFILMASNPIIEPIICPQEEVCIIGKVIEIRRRTIVK